MRHFILLTMCAAAAAVSPMSAQTAQKKTPEQMQASFNAHKGASWTKDFIKIEAKRIGPACTLQPLAAVK